MKMKLFFSLLICVNLGYGQEAANNSFKSFLVDFINKSIKADNILKGPFYVYTVRVDYFIDSTDFCIEIANDFSLAKSHFTDAEFYFELDGSIFIIEESARSKLIAEYLSFDEMDETTKQKINDYFPLVTKWHGPYYYDFYCVVKP